MQPVEFLGFAADCTISGKVTMFGERLTDFLNGQERFRVHHVECESLEDGHTVAVDSISVERTDLLAVMATGPRGSEKQRVSLQTNRLQVCIGPYLILGRLHVEARRGRRRERPPARPDDPVHERDDRLRGRRLDRRPRRLTLIVNRLLVDWISPTTETATLFPDVPVRSPFASRLHAGLRARDRRPDPGQSSSVSRGRTPRRDRGWPSRR